MARYGCFEIRTTCRHCGQPLPINGPVVRMTCRHCFEQVEVSTDALAGFVNDLEEEYDGLGDREGRGGTLMSGAGTFKYGYWRLAPRCKDCKIPLPEVEDVDTDGSVACPQCGKVFPVFPAPDWLRKVSPSAVQVIDGDRDEAEGEAAPPEQDVEPIGMSCPLCGAGLKITAEAERLTTCQYCTGDVHIPDAIWLRLHPVPKVREWWLRFEGKPRKVLDAERRVADRAAEEAYLERWKPWPTRGVPSSKLGLLKVAVVVVLAVLALVAIGGGVAVMAATGMEPEQIADTIGGLVGGTIAACAVLGVLGFMAITKLQHKVGPAGKCKAAMGALAAKLGLPHEGTEWGTGYIHGEYQGRDVEIHPEDDYAVEIDLEHYPYPFCLKTEPPGNPDDELYRFDTGDERFDRTFPIRYAQPDIHERIEADGSPLAPIQWFLERWGDKLARMEIDTAVQIHLAPGGTPEEHGTIARWIDADELGPLFEDALVLAKAIDRVSMGKEPELPEAESAG